MENPNVNSQNNNIEKLKVLELNDKVRTAKSLLILLESDLSAEHHDVYLDVVKTVHEILHSVQTDLWKMSIDE